MSTQLADISVRVNDDIWPIVPNSLVFDEGLGEQKVRAASKGGGETEQVYANDIESNVGMVRFEVHTTVDNINRAKAAKTNRNQNTVQLVGSTPEGRLTRTYQQMALLGNYEIAAGSETNITIEFKGRTPI